MTSRQYLNITSLGTCACHPYHLCTTLCNHFTINSCLFIYLQPCPRSSQDVRTLQCAAYNDVVYKGKQYKWVPYYESRDLCSLRCEAMGAGFVVMLAPKVLDGTRCDKHSNNMCINGRCWVNSITMKYFSGYRLHRSIIQVPTKLSTALG